MQSFERLEVVFHFDHDSKIQCTESSASSMMDKQVGLKDLQEKREMQMDLMECHRCAFWGKSPDY